MYVCGRDLGVEIEYEDRICNIIKSNGWDSVGKVTVYTQTRYMSPSKN